MIKSKYLPVEGEMEDWCQINKIGIRKSLCSVDCNKSKCKNIVQLPVRKLFAVTQDIEVGDEFQDLEGHKGKVVKDEGEDGQTIEWYDGYDPMEGKEYQVVGDGYKFSGGIGYHFKVLGELSPNATWVKEGDKIKIDEIPIPVFVNVKIIDPKPLIIYKVLGPCGHYH